MRLHIEAGLNAKYCRDQGLALSIRVVANAVDGLEALIRQVVPELLTDQTSAHDPVDGYVPRGMSLGDACQLRVVILMLSTVKINDG